jgi:predicted CXXCH cytochrome family protein
MTISPVSRTGSAGQPASPGREQLRRPRGGRRGYRLSLLLALACLLPLCACDPLTVHKVTTTIFDGVPSMPPPDQYCKEYHEKTVQEELEAARRLRLAKVGNQQSQHPPFTEKRCNSCHDKNAESGFVVPQLSELCAHCHKNFLVGDFLHGPAAVGSCLKCHLPHTSENPSLLIKSKAEICSVCHVESRLAVDMHAKVTKQGLACSDCHDPHGGNNHYFLK